MPTDRQKKILSYLARKDSYTTITQLAEKFEVSERSIRYDLKNLFEILSKLSIKLETTPRLGSRLILDSSEQKEKVRQILDDADLENSTLDERANTIAQILLISGKTTVDYLAEKLYVSRNTILSDLKKVKEILEKNEIELITKAYDGVLINAEEITVRTAFMKMFGASKSDGNTTQLIAEYFKNSESIILHLQEQLNIEYSENSVSELAILFAYVLKRCADEKHISLNVTDTSEQSDLEFSSVKKALETYAKNIKFTHGDIVFISKWMKSAKILSDYSNSEISKFNDVAVKLISDMEQSLKMKFSHDSDFVNSLSMHLNVAIYRLKNNFVIVNPLEDEIKYSIGFICDLIKKSLKKYEKELGVIFPSSEIAFLAMHFGAAYESNFNQMFVPKILIVCNTGLSTSILLKSRLQTAFPRLEIVSTCKLSRLEDYLSENEIDLIISTVPISDCKVKHVVVNPLMEFKDSSRISDMLSNVSTEKSYKYLAEISNEKKHSLKDLIPKEYAIFESELSSYKDALRVCCENLVRDEKITENYADDIISATEHLGSYMVIMPEIAFAHAKNTHVFENAVGIINMKEPILFGESTKVKTIILLANKNENENLIKIINILQKNDNVKKLKNAKSYEDIENLTI